jgi:translation initiation factor IF-1
MKAMVRSVVRIALGVVLVAGAACAPGMMEEVLGDVVYPGGGVYGSELRGEVRHVDTRSRRIEVRSRDGRGVTAYYDGRTRVEYRGRGYGVSSLERGDEVSMRLRRDRGRYLYADYIYVTESARDRGGWGRDDRGRDDDWDRRRDDRDRRDRDAWRSSGRLYGTVTSVDERRWRFEVRGDRGERVLVTVPSDVNRNTTDRFRRLRRGDRVDLAVRPLSDDRAELRRFR